MRHSITKLSSSSLGNISVINIHSGNYISLEELVENTIQRERNFSSFEINQQENLREFQEELFILTNDEYDDDFLAPTNFAYQSMLKFLRGLSETFNQTLPIPSFIPDGEGGIRAEWEIRGRTLSLVCPAKYSWKPYIYFEEEDFYGVEKDVKLGALTKKFRWLLNL